MAEERGGAEARRHFRGARFIMEAGLRLGLGSAALSTALGAFLRFAREHRSPYDPALVAAAALLLAGKAQGAGPRARDVINVTHSTCCSSCWPWGAGGAAAGGAVGGGCRGSPGRC
ncbi:cyclin-Q isoform X1 [Gallus gallus]|uniref:cyclin-Q isoform X1 n=1 Tax=Gallus gallus TaxID=9031 RepID=UPI001AE57EF5|nr:cyclin-Q isoform X1 [Gallus gallus]